MSKIKTKHIDDKAITLPKMADMVTASFVGRKTAGTGVPEILSKAETLALLDISGGDNLDGGTATSVYGGITAIDCGGA